MCVWDGGKGMSSMKKLKSMGESTVSCGTPFVKRFVGDCLPLYYVMQVGGRGNWQAISCNLGAC